MSSPFPETGVVSCDCFGEEEDGWGDCGARFRCAWAVGRRNSWGLYLPFVVVRLPYP